MAKEYDFREEKPSMVAEAEIAATQYADDLRYGMEVLSKVSPEKLHHIIIYLSDYAKEEIDIEEKFNALFNRWWNETCIFSGPNLCYANANFKAIKKMGKAILPYINAKAHTEPQYKQRHIQWLRKGIEA